MAVSRTGLIRRSRHAVTRTVPRPALTGGALTVLVAAAVAGCATGIAGSGTLDPVAAGNTQTQPSAQPSSTDAPPSSTAPSGPPTPTTFHMLRFDLPAGWRVDTTASSACLAAADTPAGQCTLKIVDYNTLAAQHQPGNPPQPRAPQGWWMGTGTPTCATGQTVVPVTGSTLVTSSFVKMANKTSAYSTWQVTCADSAANFAPRLWWLPVTKVVFVQHHGGAGPVDAQVDAQVDKLIASTVVG